MYTGIRGSYLSLLGGSITKPKWQKKVFSPSGGVMQMSSDTRDSSVTTCTLTVTDFNLFSSAIQEDTSRFELL